MQLYVLHLAKRVSSLPADAHLELDQVMKQQVIVYYANETSLGLRRLRRVERRIERLRDCGEDAARAAADRVSADIETFPRTTYQQVVELQRVVRDHGIEAGLAGAVFLDNETARCGWFEAQAAGYPPRKEPYRNLSACHRLLEDSPLSSPSALEAAFDVVSGLYSPADHEFLLVTRSHGTDVMAITPALPEATLDLAIASYPETKRSLEPSVEANPQDASDFGAAGLGMFDLGAGAGLGVFYGIGGKGLLLGTPELAEKEGVGITKQDYLDILEDSGIRLGMRFGLVFMDSCGSEIPRELAREVPENLAVLYGSTRDGLGYEVPDYALLGRSIDLRGGIIGAMEQLLERTANVTRFVLEQAGKRLRAI
ncbi:MAG: hypothetical protein U0790_03420 [Isosphaeraceae bacterium]